MNSLRDPFSIRQKPAFTLLRASLQIPLQNLQAEVQTKVQTLQVAAGPVLESAKERLEEAAMAFSLPKNVPSFTNPQREMEDTAWGSSGKVGGHSSSPRSPRDGMSAKISGVFGKDRDLPLYKDKPYYHSSRSSRRTIWRRKRVFAIVLAALFGLYWFGIFSNESVKSKLPRRVNNPDEVVDWNERRERVKEAFVSSWEAYEKHAWGYDQFHPISKKGNQMVPQGMGWIIVDSLDTMMLMNLTTQLSHAREWVTQSLTFNQNHEVNTFETTIRMLGGLLSAHYLSTELKLAPLPGDENEDLYLEKATDLADRLLGAYESDSGVPYASVNLKTGKGIESHEDGGASSTAEAASLQLEMKYLSKLTGEALYWEKAEKVIEVIDANGAKDGLVPIFLYASTGHFRGKEIRLGSRGDSYYEYLLKQYLQTNTKEPIYNELYRQAMNGVKKHLLRKSHPSHLTFIAELPGGIGAEISPKMDHLVCFMPGNFALGATGGLTVDVARKIATGDAKWGHEKEEDLKIARELMRTCYEMYNVTATGLAPEIAWFSLSHDDDDNNNKDAGGGHHQEEVEDVTKDIIIKRRDSHNLQRPETVESLFLMWRITGDEIYRTWGWKIFEAFMEYTKVDEEGGGGGFTSLDTVLEIPPMKRDNMESFWLAETLKYLYLLFSPNDILPLDQIVFNTEAHPFPRFDMKPLFKTGWERKPRGSDGELLKS